MSLDAQECGRSVRPNYWTLRGWHDWDPAFNWRAHWNWIDFTLVALTVERADYASPHVWEIHVALLGFHVEFIRVNRAKAAALDDMVEGWKRDTESAP